MKIDEALYQLKQNIKMHEIEGTTSNQNEREKALLDYITNLQEENKHLLYQMEKAVDYIISTYHDEPTALYGLVRADELLDILRGDE